ncbi:2-dehydro-3-deoxyphosphogluconate aldolase/4-hydroxy-2-oxoglutarate aldolase [Niallia circulans]|uniref:ketohydroxyglutarate aldolase n=1 Tax=Niallia TaxID=2837506 RepID=UPI00077C7952|nr:ketohydroxyglutarate aldolase [Niallia circulans]MCM2979391.1 ketohydroxyglutarate aldolase [Niallia circulans]MDR4318039.1 ketohydroxyglutarate aldolase [Niallia circulans]MED3839110.1 ketohydroxyglutarate aldolase [Niallia circulans]MED4242225.1 ketohydroxyglutarate aldolase [Niallia circulans]MED4250667.1 ketohydroxyglutarate aldolase [Niallia circulans]
MYKNNILNRIENTAIMAIVRVETLERAYEIADGCLAGGVDVLEISYTLPNAGEIIKGLNEKYGARLLVGAGTVLDTETARLAILAGAKFIIAPNYKEEVSRICNRYQIPYAPGCTTISEMVDAMESGASMIKAFPISNYYGSQLGTVFKTPIPYMPIMASGGVTIDNIIDWFENGIDCVGIGSLLTKGTSSQIEQNARELVEKLREYRNKK